ncbi:MAG TPA: alpha/beta hydrolase-fold protein [Candidatus Limnocylindrales bacterium]|nr:alpha/beta hydrolase-fold protein [Candidatus Limnocylindrales bacterium]
MASLLERAQKKGNPVIENGEAVFVWEGKKPPILSGDFNHWQHDQPLDMTETEPKVWTARLPLPPDTYMEYGFFASPADDDRLRDPLSRRRKPNGIGQHNHWFGMPGWKPAPETKRKRGVLSGRITEEVVSSPHQLMAGKQRKAFLYQPPTGAAVPLLLVWDGPDYLRRAFLNRIVDNLIAQGRIRPIAMLKIDNGSKLGARGIEYHTSEATVAFAEGELLPFAHQHLNLIDERKTPGVHAVLGASMGGLMALTTGFMLPRVFGHVISQAGMYQPWTSHDRPLIFDALAGSITPLPRIWLDCGTFDGLLDGNRQLHDLLLAKGGDVTYREYHTGHNYTAWANSVVGALEVMFPKGS